jgi:hypothetical protein
VCSCSGRSRTSTSDELRWVPVRRVLRQTDASQQAGDVVADRFGRAGRTGEQRLGRRPSVVELSGRHWPEPGGHINQLFDTNQLAEAATDRGSGRRLAD